MLTTTTIASSGHLIPQFLAIMKDVLPKLKDEELNNYLQSSSSIIFDAPEVEAGEELHIRGFLAYRAHATIIEELGGFFKISFLGAEKSFRGSDIEGELLHSLLSIARGRKERVFAAAPFASSPFYLRNGFAHECCPMGDEHINVSKGCHILGWNYQIENTMIARHNNPQKKKRGTHKCAPAPIRKFRELQRKLKRRLKSKYNKKEKRNETIASGSEAAAANVEENK
jgi:GNAT superfamily N-acetyltransferase